MLNKDKQNASSENSIRDSILEREKLVNDCGTIGEKDPIDGRENLNTMNIQKNDSENFKSAKKNYKPSSIISG